MLAGGRVALLAAAVFMTANVPAPVLAHPTDVAYASRGECEAAFAAASKEDRDFLVGIGVHENNGDFQKGIHDLFECEYVEEAGAWYIVYIGPAGGPG